MSTKIKLLLFSSLMLSLECIAGGYDFPVEVTEFYRDQKDSYSFSAVLRPVSNERSWPEEKCDRLRVEGDYDSVRWLRYKRPMSKDKHFKSIDYLEKSVGKIVFFGVIGSGLKEVSKCSFLSKGLFMENVGDHRAVLSVHDRI